MKDATSDYSRDNLSYACRRGPPGSSPSDHILYSGPPTRPWQGEIRTDQNKFQLQIDHMEHRSDARSSVPWNQSLLSPGNCCYHSAESKNVAATLRFLLFRPEASTKSFISSSPSRPYRNQRENRHKAKHFDLARGR
jgi:hypothetical protein